MYTSFTPYFTITFSHMNNVLTPEIYAKVRLKPADLDAIVQAFKRHFSENDSLWIFGSRVDLQARGGDIDLYVETKTDAKLAVEAKSKFVIDIWKQIGEQKIDVVINLLKDDFYLPIYDIAIKQGVKLL